jgi:hypothetical protein
VVQSSNNSGSGIITHYFGYVKCKRRQCWAVAEQENSGYVGENYKSDRRP